MIRPIVAALALAVSMSAAAQDPVATAASVNGTVQVNQGSEFVPLAPGQSLNPGDRVMAMASSSATIRFADGCTINVAPETMVVVPTASNCAGGVVATQTAAPAGSGPVGAEYAGGVDWRGAAIVTGIVVVGDAILFSQDESDNDTVSP